MAQDDTNLLLNENKQKDIDKPEEREFTTKGIKLSYLVSLLMAVSLGSV